MTSNINIIINDIINVVLLMCNGIIIIIIILILILIILIIVMI